MKEQIEALEPFDAKSHYLNVIVETPKGSHVKFAYEPATGFFVVTKALPEGMVYPFNFGFIPRTLSEDGDALDVLILNDEPLVCGCLLRVRPVAVVKAMQTEKGGPVRNDRIIGQAMSKEQPLVLPSLHLEKSRVSQIELFFAAYNSIYGKKFKVLGTSGRREATHIINRAIRAYQSNENS